MGRKMETYIPRFFKSPDQSYFLFGPRGTGKSTYLKNNFPEALWIDLLKPDVFRTYTAKPEHLIELVQGNPDKNIIVMMFRKLVMLSPILILSPGFLVSVSI